MRLGTVFVIICMIVIAASVGALAHLALGYEVTQSATLGFATLALLGIYHSFSARTGIQSAVTHQFADLARGDADLARQVNELARRVDALEHRLDHAPDRARAAIDPIAREVGALAKRVKQLTQAVSAQESAAARMAERSEALVPPAIDQPDDAASSAMNLPIIEIADIPERAPCAPAVAFIRDAIDADRIEAYLQPIVTLPQRKVRYYEAMCRLRAEGGEVLPAGDFIADAETGGLLPEIDAVMAFRCVQVVRRLLLKNRDIGVFCNLSRVSLGDPGFPQLLALLDANRAIAPSLVLEFSQAAVDMMGPVERESMARLAERGYRFSLDNVIDLRLDPRELASSGFRFIKIPARSLLTRSPVDGDVDPSELSDRFGRFGIDLIADKIESEDSVVDLLDCDVRYGQGFLFSPPRPMRAEAQQGMAERKPPREPLDPSAVDRSAGRPLPAGTDGPRLPDRQLTRGLARHG